MTYQGRILRPDGLPLSGAATQFKLQIRTPDSNNCLMYEEIQTLDLRNTNGQFSLTINDGTGSRTDSTGFNLDRIFANRGSFTFNPSTCSAGSAYTPNQSDGRDLVVLFKDETMAVWEPIPPVKINFVPFAFEAKQIAGFTSDSLLRVVDGSGDPLTGVSPLSNAQYTALLDLLNGTSAQYTKAGQLNGVALPTMNSGEVLGWNGSAWVSTTSTPGANSVTTTMIQNGAVDGTKLDPAISISTSGSIASAITTTRDFKIYAPAPSTFYVGMLADPTLAASYTLTWPLTKGTNGQVLTSDGAGKLTWASPSSAGITDLTGDVTATGPGSAAATVAAVGGSTAANVHSAELAANAATDANTASTIVKRDASGNFAANIGTFNGVALNNAGSIVNVVNPLGAAYTLTLPTGTGTNGQVLTTNGSGVTSWTTVSSSGGDFMKDGSVAMTGAFKAASGTYAAPSITFAADTATGLTGASGNLSFSAGGALAANLTSSGLSVTGALDSSRYYATTFGSAATPTYALNGGNFGMYSAAANVIGFSTSSNERLRITSGGNVGIGTTAPNGKLDVKGSIVLSGATSGYTGFQPAAAAGSTIWTLPSADGTSGQVLSTDGSGILSWTTPSGAPTGSAGGDLSGSYPNPAVATVGTSSAANVHSAELLANAATAANTSNAIVKRDGTGNFTANVGTFNGLALNNAGSVVNLVNPTGAAYTLTLPTGTGTNGQVLTTNGSGVMSWANAGAGSSWSANGTHIYNANSGNVGIGTSTPSSLFTVGADNNFQVDGSGNTLVQSGNDSGLRVDSGSAGYGILKMAAYDYGGGGAIFFADGHSSWAWDTALSRQAAKSLTLDDGSGGAAALYVTGKVGIGTTSPQAALDVNGNAKVGRMVSSVGANANALSAITADFSSTNMIRSSGATAACGTLNFANVAAGGSYTITIPNANATCSTIQLNGSGTNVKLPSGYSGGAAASGVVYTAVYDGTTLWVSYIPF